MKEISISLVAENEFADKIIEQFKIDMSIDYGLVEEVDFLISVYEV